MQNIVKSQSTHRISKVKRFQILECISKNFKQLNWVLMGFLNILTNSKLLLRFSRGFKIFSRISRTFIRFGNTLRDFRGFHRFPGILRDFKGLQAIS